MRARRLAALLAIGGLGATSCIVDDLELAGLSCPCGEGWVCECGECVPVENATGGECGGSGQGGAGGGDAPWADLAFAKRRRLDVAPVDEALAGFVVQVRLDAERIDYATAGAGEGLRFTDSEGTSLPHEIDRWDPEGTSVIWVAVGAVPTEGRAFYVYYDNPEAEDAQDAAATWSGDYRAVWHLDDSLRDATANGNDGTNGGSADAEGVLGRARDFDGIDDWIDVGSDPSIDDVFANGATVVAYVRANSFGGLDFGRIVDKSANTAGEGGWGFELDNAAGNADRTLRFERGFDSNVSAWFGPEDAVVVGQWHTVGMVYDEASGDAPRFFVDGLALPASDDGLGSGAPTSDAPQTMRLGNHGVVDSRGFDGLIDEVRIAATVRSNAWMAAEHASLTDELLSYGPEESRP